jgi:hypothetical protein
MTPALAFGLGFTLGVIATIAALLALAAKLDPSALGDALDKGMK